MTAAEMVLGLEDLSPRATLFVVMFSAMCARVDMGLGVRVSASRLLYAALLKRLFFSFKHLIRIFRDFMIHIFLTHTHTQRKRGKICTAIHIAEMNKNEEAHVNTHSHTRKNTMEMEWKHGWTPAPSTAYIQI